MLTLENITIETARYRWYGAKEWSPIITDINLSLPPGEIVALVGGSGEGKSILLQCILEMLPPNLRREGRILLDGAELNKRNSSQWRGKILSYIPQSINSLNPLLKVETHLIRSQRLSGQRICRKQINTELEHNQLKPGVLTLYPRELSGGMAKRVLACNATLSKARYILADEITAWLDETLASQLLSQLRSLSHKGAGILWVTHDLSQAVRYADRIVTLHRGRIIDNIPASSLHNGAGSPTLRQQWGSQPEFNVLFAQEKASCSM